MGARILGVMVLLSGCFNQPVWLDECEPCGDNLCVRDDATYDCLAIPESCAVAYTGDCDPAALDRPCAVDVCGEFEGEWEFTLDCQTRGGRVYHYADCTDVGTAAVSTPTPE